MLDYDISAIKLSTKIVVKDLGGVIGTWACLDDLSETSHSNLASEDARSGLPAKFVELNKTARLVKKRVFFSSDNITVSEDKLSVIMPGCSKKGLSAIRRLINDGWDRSFRVSNIDPEFKQLGSERATEEYAAGKEFNAGSYFWQDTGVHDYAHRDTRRSFFYPGHTLNMFENLGFPVPRTVERIEDVGGQFAYASHVAYVFHGDMESFNSGTENIFLNDGDADECVVYIPEPGGVILKIIFPNTGILTGFSCLVLSMGMRFDHMDVGYENIYQGPGSTDNGVLRIAVMVCDDGIEDFLDLKPLGHDSDVNVLPQHHALSFLRYNEDRIDHEVTKHIELSNGLSNSTGGPRRNGITWRDCIVVALPSPLTEFSMSGDLSFVEKDGHLSISCAPGTRMLTWSGSVLSSMDSGQQVGDIEVLSESGRSALSGSVIKTFIMTNALGHSADPLADTTLFKTSSDNGIDLRSELFQNSDPATGIKAKTFGDISVIAGKSRSRVIHSVNRIVQNLLSGDITITGEKDFLNVSYRLEAGIEEDYTGSGPNLDSENVATLLSLYWSGCTIANQSTFKASDLALLANLLDVSISFIADYDNVNNGDTSEFNEVHLLDSVVDPHVLSLEQRSGLSMTQSSSDKSNLGILPNGLIAYARMVSKKLGLNTI
jgi:hypothetical protein